LGVWLAWRLSAPEEAPVSEDPEADETAEVDGSESR
jgi:K+ transport system, NAD-binding component